MKKHHKQTFVIWLVLTLLAFTLYIALSSNKHHANCNVYVSQKASVFSNSQFFSATAREARKNIEQCVKNAPHPYEFHYHASVSDLNTTLALQKSFAKYQQKIVGVMGRGSLHRDSKQYLEAALIGKTLAEADYIVVTGGGPGAMEATHLGVWFAGRPKKDLLEAIAILSKSPTTHSKGYQQKTELVKQKYPRVKQTIDLAIPTLVYGVSQSTTFAHYYVSYFNNAIREETLLILSKNGVVLLPGGFGTMLELFMALEYNSDGIKTNPKRPIVLFNQTFWQRVLGPELLNTLFKTDSIEALVDYLASADHQELKKVR